MIRRSSHLVCLTLLVLLTLGCINLPPFGPSNNRGKVALEWVKKPDHFYTREQVLLLPLSGLVTVGDLGASVRGDVGMLVELKDRLDAARENRQLRAVVLRIDSPGGTVTAADLIHQELVKFKQETGLPMIALMGETAASGGLYIAMAADEIYALPTTLTGSIGVIAMFPNLEDLSRKVGFKMNVVKSGAMKDAGSPWRTMNAADRKVFENLVTNYNTRFRNVIMAARSEDGLTTTALDAIADGRVLQPAQALEAKLIDGIAYHDEVVARARMLAGIRDAAIVSYEYPYHYRGNIYARNSAADPRMQPGEGSVQFNLLALDGNALLRELAGARFFYLWLP